MAYKTPCVMIRCQTVVLKEDVTRATVMTTRPEIEATRRNRGLAWRVKNINGAPRYMIPDAEVPIIAMPEILEAKRGKVL